MSLSTLQHDSVILVDDAGRQIGTAQKNTVHTLDTPLHLAFSCYVFNSHGQVLITRRSLAKTTWPGVWTNSFCGHPLPGEDPDDAVRRRAQLELGLDLDQLKVVAPQFRYRATDASGIVENELCPVYRATTTAEPRVNPDEVMEFAWTDTSALHRAARDAPWAFSPWMVLQLRELGAHDA
ncbi:isopentenyl-diphosphate Delta-isomerase [Leifsonia kafniensis]|uniref:Isopentenyl-diphosphate Delta-isomerase n=1 Tax=Leifsonia kafniensis TaxID=475957 RepID=A0ABP7KNF3_9MICO